MSIEPNPHWYGTYARRSALADYLELLSLDGRSLASESIADLIRDNGWTSCLGARIDMPSIGEDEDFEDLGEEQDQALVAAQDILAVIDQRASAVGLAYPFSREPAGQVSYTGSTPQTNPYIRLLAITVGHAVKLDLSPKPYQVFEAMVSAAMTNAGFRTDGLGERSRSGAKFSEILSETCSAVGLVAYPDRAASRSFANDEGSDILSNVWDFDRRPGGLQLIGQVTCATSNDWDLKMQEPAPLQWRSWLGGLRSPSAYLAVPHHVEDSARTWLMERRDRDILDRLRLSCILSADPVHGETAIVSAVLAEHIE